jgi:hypothetical protein
VVEGGSALAAAGWLLVELLAPKAVPEKIKVAVRGGAARRHLVAATDQAIRTAVSRSSSQHLTEEEVGEVVAVFNQLWPTMTVDDLDTGTLLERFEEVARIAVSRSLEPVDVGEGFGQVTSLSALREQHGLELDPDCFAGLLCRCWVDSVRSMARSVPVLMPWADQLNHDLSHAGLAEGSELARQTSDAVEDLHRKFDRMDAAWAREPSPAGTGGGRGGGVPGSMPVPLEVARLDPARVFTDAEVEGFTGREWLIGELDEFLATRRCGYVWLEAEAGLGKTAVAAWLVRTRGYAGHFSRQSSDPQVVLRNLAAQVITTRGLERFTQGGLVPGWAATGAGLGSLLEKATPAGSDRLVLVVDGMDEIGDPQPDRLPLGLPPTLPDGVFVVGTCRTGYRPGVPEGDLLRLRITADDKHNRKDMYEYLSTAAAEDVLAAKLAGCGITAEEFCQLAAARCGGVWVYLRYLLSEIRLGSRRADDWDDLPDNLWDYYLRQLRRWQHQPAWPDLRVVLAVLAALAEPADAPTLGRLAGIDDLMLVRRCCDLWARPFLTASGTPRLYEIYHASFRQFLNGELAKARSVDRVDEAAVAEQLRQDVTRAHGRIADDYLRLFGGLGCNLDKLAAEPGLAGVDGGYPLRHLARHLEHAGRGEDLHRLLACSRAAGQGRAVNVWFDTHDYAGTPDSFIHDVDRARRLADAATDAQIRAGTRPTGLAREVRYALMTASIHTMTNNVSPQLLLALVNAGVWNHTRALGHARRLEQHAARAEALTGLAPHLPAEQRPVVLAEALRAATAITHERFRAEALTGLAPHLPVEQRRVVLAEALRVATAITDEYYRAQALTGLAPHLPVEQRPVVLAEALRAATAITDERFRAQALTGLAPHLAAEQLAEALRAATAITNEGSRAEALTGVAPHLSAEQLVYALQGGRGYARLAEAVLDRSRTLRLHLTISYGVRLFRLALQQSDRSTCLLMIGKSASQLAQDTGNSTLIETHEAIGEVCSWWP